MKIIVFIIIIALIIFFVFFPKEREIQREYGILIDEEPKQINLNAPKEFTIGDYNIRKMAEFDITARVLSKRRYRRGRETDLSRFDLALGWGPMSDTRVLNEIRISQRNRWYYWRVDRFPVPRQQIEHNSANMHLLTDDESINRQIAGIRRGNIIRIQGYLVFVSAEDGWRWRSSLTRTDTGAGSCEIIWIKTFEVID